MKNLLLATIATVAIAGSASADSFVFSLPNLTFPPATDITVAKDCMATNMTSGACIPQE